MYVLSNLARFEFQQANLDGVWRHCGICTPVFLMKTFQVSFPVQCSSLELNKPLGSLNSLQFPDDNCHKEECVIVDR